MSLDKYLEANRVNWDERVPYHIGPGSHYDLERFIAGGSTLTSIDTQDLGDVTGKSLLHLQCHFGLDTLSWARRGAKATGIDFSRPAIDAAAQLSKDSGISGRFPVSELYQSANVLDERFDIVYTGIGALCWLPDIRGWANVVSHFLKPGGTFYMLEFHPIIWSLDDERSDAELVIKLPYFQVTEPNRWDDPTTYGNLSAHLNNTITYEWNHGLGEILTALIGAGLVIEFVHEHQVCATPILPPLVRGEDGWWRLPDYSQRLPLMYSIRAHRVHDL